MDHRLLRLLKFLGGYFMMQKLNLQKIKALLISTSCGILSIYLLLPRRELENHSILRSLVAPPKLRLFPDEVSSNYEKYMRSLYGANWKKLTSILPRQRVVSLIEDDLEVFNFNLGVIWVLFLGFMVTLLIYRFGFKKSKETK